MDKIDDAYNGLMGEEFMRKTRERLHWICSKVAGEKILDVGCSQGTLARLLAPLGKSILGVDINKDAISYAEGKLPELDAASRERLQFVAMNFMDFKYEERFDTVVMGEILEHLPDPSAFVKKACAHLVKGGTIVATVPFGINDDPDHRQTFYWSWIRDIIAPLFDVKDIEFFGKWIGVVGVKRERRATVEDTVPLVVVKELEKAFYAIERPLVNDNRARGIKLKAQSQSLAEAKKDLDAKVAEARTALSAETAKQKETIAKLTADRAAADAVAAKQKTALAAEQAKVNDLNSKLVAARNELAATKNEALELRVNLDADRRISDGQAEQISVLKAALQFAANRQQIETNDTRLLEYSQEVRELRSALESKREEAVERAERLGHLSGQVESLKAEKELLSTRIAELAEALDKKTAEAASAAEYAKLFEPENARLEGERESLLGKVAELSAREKDLEESLASATAESDSKTEAINRIAAERTEFERDNALLRQDCKEKDSRLAELQNVSGKMAELEQKNSQCAAALAKEKARVAELTADLAQTRKAAADKADVLSNSIGELEAYAKLCEAEIAKLTNERKELGREKTRLSEDIGAVRAEKESVVAALANAKAEKGGLLANITKIETALDAANKAGIAKDAKVAALTSELEESKSARDAASKEAAALTAELERRRLELGEEKSKLETALDAANKAGIAKDAKVAALTSELEKIKVEHKEALLRTQKYDMDIKNVRLLLEQEKKKSADVLFSFSKLNHEFSALSKKNKDLTRKLSVEKSKYEKLARAKLGRLTLAYWGVKDNLKARFGLGECIRESSPDTGSLPAAVPAKPAATKPAETSKTAVASAKPAAEPVKTPPPKGDEGFLQRMAERIRDMPESNGCRYFVRSKMRIAVVCDQFYWDSVCFAADFVYVRPEEWRSDIDKIDCLLIVSAWHGLNGTDWQGLPYEGSKRRILAYEIIDECKAKGVPTVFYSKEDPPSYKEFLGIAKRCEYVFTSAEECVPDYRRDCGHDRVWPLCFCVNPEYHNPVGMRHVKKEDGVIFSGTWMTKFPERCRDLASLLDGVLAAGREMRIIDRCYHLRSDERYRYPDKYAKSLSPAIDHKMLQKVHKIYNWAININTVRDSRTMFANRVFELQASGNLLLSNYSVGVSNMFPVVFMPYDASEVRRILNGFSPEEIYERQTAGIRRVMSGETCYDRIAEMMSRIGLQYNVPRRKVLVVCDRITDRIREMFDLQTYSEKTLMTFSSVSDSQYNDCDFVAFFDECITYGAFYLEDMINAFKFTDSDYVSKVAYVEGDKVVEGPEHEYICKIPEKGRTVFWRASFSWDELRNIKPDTSHGNGYAADHFNCVKNAVSQTVKRRADVSVIIPIHNNGWYLYGRSFAGLRRSSIFDRMEIVLVDDGSTDGFTPKMVRHIESRYPNVKTFFFNDGGSGTPSRPRNKGVEIASAPNIIFCDPDNEPICDGYATLLNVAESEPGLDVTLGNTVRCDGRNMTFDYYSVIKHNNDNNVVVTDGRKVLSATSFLAPNIQTMVISKAFIQKNNLTQVVGGIGEDSQFSNEVMLACNRLKVVPVKVQIYYAERGDSLVNAIKENFFVKHRRTEEVRVKWLKGNNLMTDYVAKRFESYVTLWYFDKLRAALPQESIACARCLYGILSLYRDYYHGGNQRIDKFLDLCGSNDFSSAYISVFRA